jgi:carboxypeptidase family protein
MLENIRIASPCSADWEQMPGDDRVRHCQACNLNVYNLTAFTEQEIRELVANRQGRLCGRIYQRRDGTALTQNCPVGMRAVARRISRIAGAVFTVLAGSFIAGRAAVAQSYTETDTRSAGVTVEVIDPSGADVPEAEVTLSDFSFKTSFHGKTDKNGRVTLWAPTRGQYSLTASAPGMFMTPKAVVLRTSEILSLPLRLKPLIVTMGDIATIEPAHKPSKKNPASAQPPANNPAPKTAQH